jgi:hypothetical protein
VVANAASDVEDDVIPPELRVLSHKPEPVFEQPLRVAVLLIKSRAGTLIEEGPDVGGVVYASGRQALKSRTKPSSFFAERLPRPRIRQTCCCWITRGLDTPPLPCSRARLIIHGDTVAEDHFAALPAREKQYADRNKGEGQSERHDRAGPIAIALIKTE